LRDVLLTLLAVSSFLTVIEGQPLPICRDSQECRQLALDAAARGEYERFHDLAWRAVQTGPRNDSGLMYLLARAQVLSGRPHDALVMLQRLADTGVAADAVTDADFRRTRALPGWPEVAAAIARAEAPAPAAAPAPTPAPTVEASRSTGAPAPVGSPVVPFPLEPAPTSDAGRFSAVPFLAAGLAYDAVSRRFVIGDALGRKLIVVGVGSEHADDMVRADSAEFDDVVALAIDEKRGDLWVASTADASGESALHRLQLVSGRPLKTYRAVPAMGPTRLAALAVQASGSVVALDSAGNRLLLLSRGHSDTTVAMSLKLSGAKSIAAGDDGVIYVAHDEGIARVDLVSKTLAALSAPEGFDLRRFEAIRAHRTALVGLQTTPAGSRQLVRLTLDAAGRAVREGAVIDPRVAETEGYLSLTITGDELYYLATDAPGAGPGPSPSRSPGADQFVVRRLTLN